MALKNEAPRIVAAMEALSVARVTRGWPTTEAELPVIYISEAGNTPASFADDLIYLDELTYDVRIFSYEAGEIDDIAALVETEMEALGYRRILVHDNDSGETRMKVMRYVTYM